MSVSNINNVASLLSKTYGTDNSAATTDTKSQSVKKADAETTSASSTSASESASVTLGASDTTTPTYTAQGLLQQMRQYQLSNTSLLFGSDDSESDTTGLTGLTGSSSNSEIETMSQDWANTIANDPGKAAVMVENSKSESLNTIFGGN